jgi:hypothetical protein
MATSIQFRAALARYKATRINPAPLQTRNILGSAMAEGLVRNCPVRTGKTRANMQVTVGAGKARIAEIEDPEGSATIARMISVVENSPVEAKLTFSNPVPWMPALDAGSSRQAPLGVFRVTLRQLRAQFPALMQRVRRSLGGQFIVR